MNNIAYLVPKNALEALKDIRDRETYDIWLNELVEAHKAINANDNIQEYLGPFDDEVLTS